MKTKSESIRILRLIQKSVGENTALGNISSSESSTPFKVLISTILSARTRDPVTEKASESLFSRFPDSESLSGARTSVVASLIFPVSFYRVKAYRIIRVAKRIERDYLGEVPNDINKLLTLPGVGRKTANCVLVYAFKIPAIPVDIHVHRVSNRIGLVKTKTPEETEEWLSRQYKEKYWLDVNEQFVKFGQTICKPITPLCSICGVRPLCNYYKRQSMALKQDL